MAVRWAQGRCDRRQLVLMGPTVDEMIGEDDPIRLFEDLLKSLSWESWEQSYQEGGQPPIHPRLVAGCMLWGLVQGIRSTRRLEDATRYRTDFIWFLDGRTIDHTTFAKFRTSFREPLAELSRDLTRKGLELARSRAKAIGVDGTLIRANSDWQGARGAQALQRTLDQLGLNIESLLDKLAEGDVEQADDELAELQRRLAEAEQEKAKLQRALKAAQTRDARKDPSLPATRVPVTDPDAQLTLNKRGGFAPNYTPIASVDLESGIVLDANVLEDGNSEAKSLPAAVQNCEETTGHKPHSVCADGGFADGAVFAHLEQENVNALIPVTELKGAERAQRPDPTEPLSAEAIAALPRRGRRFSAACFLYDHDQDCYYCPAGQRLDPWKRFHHRGPQRDLKGVEYRTAACPSCPLLEACVKAKSRRRTIIRTQYSDLREAAMARLADAAGAELYKRRAPIVEGVFAVIKQIIGLRQFLTRGHAKVQTEWRWACTAYNVKKILKLLAAGHPGRRDGSHAPAKPLSSSRKRPFPPLWTHIRRRITFGHSRQPGPLPTSFATGPIPHNPTVAA